MVWVVIEGAAGMIEFAIGREVWTAAEAVVGTIHFAVGHTVWTAIVVEVGMIDVAVGRKVWTVIVVEVIMATDFAVGRRASTVVEADTTGLAGLGRSLVWVLRGEMIHMRLGADHRMVGSSAGCSRLGEVYWGCLSYTAARPTCWGYFDHRAEHLDHTGTRGCSLGD